MSFPKPGEGRVVYTSSLGVCKEHDGRFYWFDAHRPDHWTFGAPSLQRVMEHEEFIVRFWEEKVAWLTRSDVARIDGDHYIVGAEDAPNSMRGYGGRKFGIKFNDGRVVITTNLWHQGTIPEAWREKLPNNAVWLDDVQIKLHEACAEIKKIGEEMA